MTNAFANLGSHLRQARQARGLTQRQLAARCGLGQPKLVRFETGVQPPTPEELGILAEALAVPIQRFMSGTDLPGSELADLVVELRALGAADLLVTDATVPGAFRPPEQVVSLAVSSGQPDPRIVGAIPAVLAWNNWNLRLFDAYARTTGRKAHRRLAWLADVVLTIDRLRGFPGGCPAREQLTRFVSVVRPPREPDSLGAPAPDAQRLHLVWKRWLITYDGDLRGFEERAKSLCQLRMVRWYG